MSGAQKNGVDGFEIERVGTGNPALDQILHGGFPRNSINIVMGPPGTGKTIFVEQMVFHNARGGRPILYLTTLSEPLAKVVTYLQGFAFYDEEKLLDKVTYDDIGARLAEEGADVIVDTVRTAIRDIRPAIIVVDSFKAVHDLAESPTHMRRVIAELAGILTAYDTTVFLVGEYGAEHVPEFPEFAVADGIVEFARRSTAKRDERFMRVLKLRGSGYAEGFHAFIITREGLRVHPRLVSPGRAAGYATATERVPTGVPGLDDILNGGLWAGSTVLVTGAAGTGKTTLALQFALEGVRQGGKSLVVNFQENPTQMARTVAALGTGLEELEAAGLHFMYVSPVELSIDSIVGTLFETVREKGVNRVAVDALGDLATAADDRQRFHDYLYALCQRFVVGGVTALLTMEMSPTGTALGSLDAGRFSSMSDALIELGLAKHPPHRTLRVVKARGIDHDLRQREMRIEAGGVRVLDPVEAT